MKYSFLDLGFIDYNKAYIIQRHIFDKVTENGVCGQVLFAEHNSILTQGRSAKDNNVLLSKSELEKKNLKLIKVERGGDVTYHGPGQLVMYPVINLKDFKPDVRQYVNDLEEVVIRLLKKIGIRGFRLHDKRGVWTSKGKVASLGVAIRKWVTFHGLSLNICPEKNYFSYIRPCGLEADQVASIKDFLGDKVYNYRIKSLLKTSFNRVFGG